MGDLIRWSKWKKFTDKNIKSIPNSSGVYKIRCTDASGKAVPISRVRGIDHNGIIYIGRYLGNLRTRIKSFYDSANGKTYTHIAGGTYFDYYYDTEFPLDQLEFKFLETSRKKAIKKRR